MLKKVGWEQGGTGDRRLVENVNCLSRGVCVYGGRRVGRFSMILSGFPVGKVSMPS